MYETPIFFFSIREINCMIYAPTGSIENRLKSLLLATLGNNLLFYSLKNKRDRKQRIYFISKQINTYYHFCIIMATTIQINK